MNIKEVIENQFKELIKKYPSFILYWEDDIGIVKGELNFKALYNGVVIADTYTIKIEIPSTYPSNLPMTKEIGGRIPLNFHRLANDYLCLEVPTKMKIIFMQNPTLLFYVEKFVVEYLYGFSYKEKFGRLPYGEHPHGNAGIIDFYKELFGVTDINSILKFLKILSNSNYRGHHLCPCNSEKKLRNCHGKTIRELMQLDIAYMFRFDLDVILRSKTNRF
ncbi:MAG: SEC-C domain-containing protein [Tepidanaerobacter acetatoxydans]|uniref:SEC-C motif domain protein n=1 Tax=Tepidanaerobacter acetatoxydans (strain DSM 21804 / JCM 16047 / Re1) TaxID=1209989 RepID=F4LXF4_TEPAE|nr:MULTISPECIES: SEC-C domain-containing protein [Tepidanaerobacter]AEE91056.1 hypothetical protein TepRe1_0881 [Tepidanaerobacter acetatoxydans Re1]NLU10440.1 SEC-C domain-containing protein [Tepidanaerobacter acetatoxydans]CCP25675.1 conserved protein of unknown function [Tepidanaerobacter acetatoxydans Re1]